MKRLAMAVVALTAFAVAAEAGSPFEPVKLVDSLRVYHYTHYVRGAEKGKKHGGSREHAGRGSRDGAGQAVAQAHPAAGPRRLKREPKPVQHPVDDDTRRGDVEPERKCHSRQALVRVEARGARACEGDQDERHDHALRGSCG